MHNPANLQGVTADLTAFGLPKLPTSAVPAFVKSLVAVGGVESYLSASAASDMATFAQQQGITNGYLAPSKWMAPGVPGSIQQVRHIVTGAGGV